MRYDYRMKKAFTPLLTKGYILLYAVVLLLNTSIAFAAYGNKDTLQGYIVLVMQFINYTLLPVIFGIALLFFLVNAARYFIIEGADSEGREKAKKLALYGIGAFVFLVSIWGIVNMLVGGLGFGNGDVLCPDYLGDICVPASNNPGGDIPLYFDDSPDQSDSSFNPNCYYDYNIDQEICD